MPADAFARAALDLVGTRFRLHGRDPATGLDCLGVIASALRASRRPCELPTGYRIRTADWPSAADWAARNGFAAARPPLAPGDVLITRSGPAQLHLAVVSPDALQVIEAHAGLAKVVCSPLPTRPAILHLWRLLPSS